ncbi:unnamed protein product [Vitrella brassicaformis CCMP3155]|uniref:Uncharacterized protein n=2 Tax=Vitrella brassicaformis TaxID=1169539 RepID=A0A0G4EZS9_VITBC|nr:unnamed protein product [Vitrella brassicaformis CCMP3155]|eukprot:CEM04528.1 unnamed protein product [Vitrella brassicaformis CCMP3155]
MRCRPLLALIGAPPALSLLIPARRLHRSAAAAAASTSLLCARGPLSEGEVGGVGCVMDSGGVGMGGGEVLPAVVRIVDEEPSLLFSYTWGGKMTNLNRPKDEPLERMLSRIKINCQKALKPKSKSKRKNNSKGNGGGGGGDEEGQPPNGDEMDVAVSLLREDRSAVAESTGCAQAFSEASVLTLNGQLYAIHVNPPAVKTLEVNQAVIVGCPVIPFVETEFEDPSTFVFEWYRKGHHHTSPPHWLAYGPMYVPTPEDIGSRLELRAYHPSLPAFGSSTVVEAIQQPPPAGWRERRIATFARQQPKDTSATQDSLWGGWGAWFGYQHHQQQEQERASPPLRVCSFNVLAPILARTPVAQFQMFPYCLQEHLDIGYRRPMIARELLELDCDLMCLQETQLSFYQNTLVPLFGDIYHPTITLKAGKLQEGSACLLRRDRFDLLEKHDITFRDSLLSEPALQDAVNVLRQKWPHFFDEVLPHLTTIFQLLLLQDKVTHRLLIVANTHLFFHPQAKHIRLLQTALLLHRIHQLKARCEEAAQQQQQCDGSPAGQRVGVVLCGDLNSVPWTAAIQLLKTGYVESDHRDWKTGPEFHWSRDVDEEEQVEEAQKIEKENAEGHPSEPSAAPAPAPAPPTGADSLPPAPSSDDAPPPSPAPPPSSAVSSSIPPLPHWVKNSGAGGSDGRDGRGCVPPDGWGVELSADVRLVDAYEASGCAPKFTNWVNNFRATLDYVMVDECFQVCRVLPPISEDDIRPHHGLPSVMYPSDHLAIAAEIRWRR